MLEKLSKKHRIFVEAYDGDEVYAMRVAGYVGADSYLKSKCLELLSEPLILEAIKERSKYQAKLKSTIASREERQELWTAIMRNSDPHRREEKDADGIPVEEGNIPLPIRLKASEMLGKSEADFVEKIDMTVTKGITDVIAESYNIDTPIEQLRAERDRIKLEKQKAIETTALPVPEVPKKLEELI